MVSHDLWQTGWLWEPWRHLETLQNEVERAFTRQAFASGAAPTVNVWRSEEGLLVRAELAGVDPESLDLAVLGDTLTLRCSKPAPEIDDATQTTVHRRERVTGNVERTLELPYRIDENAVEARFEHGILHVKLPRAAEDKPRRIQVKSV